VSGLECLEFGDDLVEPCLAAAELARATTVAIVLSSRRVWSRRASRIFGLAASAALLLVACGGGSEEAYTPPTSGVGIYKASCATCHGSSGQGFVGPSLAGTVAKYPNIADEIAIVTNGRNQMPGWGGRLTTEQIATVVGYTRAEFSTAASGPPAPPRP